MTAGRVFGAVLALAGFALLAALTALFYAPGPDAQDLLIAIGMPGVLVGALIGILILLIGLALCFVSGRVRRYLGTR